jgi:hypothetical protein
MLVCALVAGDPTAAAAGAASSDVTTGRLELTVLSGGTDVTARYTAMATNMSNGHSVTLMLSASGTLVADLPPGSYMVMAMPAGGMGLATVSPTGGIGGAVPTVFSVTIVKGQTVNRVAHAGGGGPGGEFSESDLEDLLDFVSGGAPSTAAELDLSTVPSADELVALARRYHDLYFGQLTAGERSFVESLTRKIEQGPPSSVRTADVEELTAAAAAIAAPGASRAASVVLAARAVMVMPDLALALNNFGAILRLLEELPDSVTVLVAAREADPESPMILTNLANSVRDLGDSRLAEDLYLEALAARDDFGPALSALGEIYMARGDYEKAVEVMMRGAKIGFCAAVGDSLSDAFDEAYGESDTVPPLPPAWDESGSLVPPAPSRSKATLVLPEEFGNWDDISSLAGSIHELSSIMD